MPGHAIGIQIGRSNTAVTPTDAFLNDRIAHGVRAAVGSSNLDSLTSGDDTDQKLYEYQWLYRNDLPAIAFNGNERYTIQVL